MKNFCVKLVAFLLVSFAGLVEAASSTGLEPTPLPDLQYEGQLLSGDYDPSIPTPESILGFPVGQRAAKPEQIVEAVRIWSEASDKAIAFEYARSHEGRPLYYVAISSPENLARLDEIKAGVQRLAKPVDLDKTAADAIIDSLPGIAWMAYSIHGNESSGADAALAAMYHLIASRDSQTLEMLEKLVVLVDPMQNPDGRARFARMVEQHRGAAPNIDNQSLLHTEFWPGGRTNHYYFDLNRDFFFLVHPETRGRVQAINEWYPQIIVDAHEMGGLDSYLFSPSREPINSNFPEPLRKWEIRFGNEQADAFDDYAWPYYTGEWADNFSPVYSSYAMFRGSLFILYEQARYHDDGLRKPAGIVESYREAVHHQLVSTMANLGSLAKVYREMYRDFLGDRRYVMSDDSPYADVTWAILPTGNSSRIKDFVDRMQAQGFELYTADRDISVRNATAWTGETLQSTVIPAGSLVIPNRQPEARLISAVLEFDAFISDETLLQERQELLRTGGGIMYDTTAWNLEMMYGLQALRVPDHIDSGVSAYRPPAPAPAISGAEEAIAWIVDGASDASVGFAARLMEQGVKVRAVDRAIELGGGAYPRGSVVVAVHDNRNFTGDLRGQIEATAAEMSVTAVGVDQGLGAGDLPDIGGRHFVLLERPQIALLSRGSVSPYSFGAIWHSIDSRLGIRHSHLNQAGFAYSDLRRYNVLVLPGSYRSGLSESEVEAIDTWVKAGGTLIAIDGSVSQLVDPENGISSVRRIQDTFSDTVKYDVTLQREWQSRQDRLANSAVLRSHVVPASIDYPFPEKANSADEESLKKQDSWQAQFMPQGAMLASQPDQKHWLTFGAGEVLPVVYGNSPVLMSDDGSQAVVRLGALRDSKAQEEPYPLGWATIPAGKETVLRMSGLLWPEAAQRIAHSAYLTRERKGHGQIILFASEPIFRGATLGTGRLLLNAMVYGPGMGANAAIEP